MRKVNEYIEDRLWSLKVFVLWDFRVQSPQYLHKFWSLELDLENSSKFRFILVKWVKTRIFLISWIPTIAYARENFAYRHPLTHTHSPAEFEFNNPVCRLLGKKEKFARMFLHYFSNKFDKTKQQQQKFDNILYLYFHPDPYLLANP